MNTKIRTAALQTGRARRAAGGAEGNRVAGPVAGVGGAMEAVKSVFGIPDRGDRRGGYRCRRYHDR